MESVYAWLWTYWGVLVTGIVVSLITIGIGVYYKEEEYTDTGLFAFGLVTLIGSVLFGIIWALAGPYSVHWILIPAGVVSVILFIVGKNEYEDEPVRGSLWLLAVIGLAYLVTFNDKVRTAVTPARNLAAQEASRQSQGGQQPSKAEQKSAPPAPTAASSGNGQTAVESIAKFAKGEDGWWQVVRGGGGVNNDASGGLPRVTVRDFWPAGVSPSPQGFLVTSDGTAIRVLASGYLVPLFDKPETRFPAGVVGIMKPFRAYYVIRKQDTSLLVAEPPFTPQSRTFWARQSDCYVWATGLAAEVRGNLPVYAREEDARTGSPPLTPADKYTSLQQLPNIPGDEVSPPLSKLPLLWRTAELAALLCPANGGELCWVNMARAGDSLALANGQ